MIDYKLLEQLVEFSHSNTLYSVSKKFHISHPTISRNMKTLEEHLGVSLFHRSKNHIALNETGIYAAKEMEVLLKETRNMLDRIHYFDRTSRTISIGSCSIIPCINLIQQITLLYPETSITSEIRTIRQLTEGFDDDQYQLIVLPFRPDDMSASFLTMGTDELLFSLPLNHRYSGRKQLSMKEMDGENIVVYRELGFWEEILKSKMPTSHFMIQQEQYDFNELVANSSIPTFITKSLSDKNDVPENRVYVPISDKEVHVTYYMMCKKKNQERFRLLFENLSLPFIL